MQNAMDHQTTMSPIMSPLDPSLEASSSSGHSSSKNIAIKRADGEPLTREDIQYQLLHHIFQDSTRLFTDQSQDPKVSASFPKVTFCELYINSILNSPKCTKASRDNMLENPSYAVEYAKMCLLVNVGKINTTLAFYHEMRAVLRSYHPVPSLMTSEVSERNMMDAPRMKACLKGCLLPSERHNPPTSPEEVLQNIVSGNVPPTNVVNLIFVLSAHSNTISKLHFESHVDFLDLFTPVPIPSAARARAFLWLVFRYLEGSGHHNPFNDAFSSENHGKAPSLPRIPKEQALLENVDTEEEINFAQKMKALRLQFLKTLANEEDGSRPIDGPRSPAQSDFSKEKTAQSLHFSDDMPPQPPLAFHMPQSSGHHPGSRYSPVHDQYAPYRPGSPSSHSQQLPPAPMRYASQPSHFGSSVLNQPTMYPPLPSVLRPSTRYADAPQSFSTRPGASISSSDRNQSAVQFTWSNTWNMDPLADSDEEGTDIRMKTDYERRLWVMNRLRGRELTPDPIPPRLTPPGMGPPPGYSLDMHGNIIT